MQRARAAIGSLVFLALAPGVVAGLVPWLLTGWQTRSPGLAAQVAVASTIVGQALILGRPGMLAYAAIFGAAVGAFVYGYEQPTLAARYGEQYEAYRRAVPAWWPRLRAWDGR